MPAEVKRPALYPAHLERQARMTEFAGWELPVQFAGIIAEHQAVRRQVGIFDVSHLGRLEVKGPAATALLERLLTTDVASLALGRGRYSILCQPDGGILDDLILYRRGENDYLITCNAANCGKDQGWLELWARGLGEVTIADVSQDTVMLAVQGPEAARYLDSLADPPPSTLPPFGFVQARIARMSAHISRTGYTGEDGFELVLEAPAGLALWRQLLEQGMTPCGLGARDTLRLEAGLLLYGEDMDASCNPFEVGLGRRVHLEKADFIGKEALQRLRGQGQQRQLVGFEIVGAGVARSGQAVYHLDKAIGKVTSGRHSPTLEKNLGLAVVAQEFAAPGTHFEVDVRGRRVAAQVVRLPFYRRGSRPAP